VWEDPSRVRKPITLEELMRADPDIRVIVLGDASMAPYELVQPLGAIDFSQPNRRAGVDCLRELAARFPKNVWINPIPAIRWDYTLGAYTIALVQEIFPMVDLTLGGIEKAVALLTEKG
jgi:uncharacterized protein with von Willebrand factor type A (vWA) domain